MKKNPQAPYDWRPVNYIITLKRCAGGKEREQIVYFSREEPPLPEGLMSGMFYLLKDERLLIRHAMHQANMELATKLAPNKYWHVEITNAKTDELRAKFPEAEIAERYPLTPDEKRMVDAVIKKENPAPVEQKNLRRQIMQLNKTVEDLPGDIANAVKTPQKNAGRPTMASPKKNSIVKMIHSRVLGGMKQRKACEAVKEKKKLSEEVETLRGWYKDFLRTKARPRKKPVG